MVTLDGVLPQGACTSPAVSNLVMARIDQRITKYCQVFHIRYTRYADDLLFSSSSLDFSSKRWFVRTIKHILSARKLKVNYSKTKYGKGTFSLNGYVISEQGIHLSRNRLSDIRRVISFVQAKTGSLHGLDERVFLSEANQLQLKYRDLRQHPFTTVFQFTQYMCGYRAFLISLIDSHYALTNFQKELQRLIRRLEKQILRFP